MYGIISADGNQTFCDGNTSVEVDPFRGSEICFYEKFPEKLSFVCPYHNNLSRIFDILLSRSI